MSNNNDDKTPDNGKVIHFPAMEERAKRDEEKRLLEKEERKAQKRRLQQENLWREQYKQEQKKRAQTHIHMQKQIGGKTPFINWHKIPPLTQLLCAICLVVHVIVTFLLTASQKIWVIYTFGFVPAIYTGLLPWSPYALLSPITSLFLHADWMHLGVNLFMLLAMSVFFERSFGTKRFLIFFIASGLCGDLFYLLLAPFSGTPVIGASGAISGLFAANIMIMADNGLMGQSDQRSSLKFLILWTTIIIVMGFVFGNTAWQAHLGGFLGGATLYTLLKKGKLRF